jgi:hypothetical protein
MNNLSIAALTLALISATCGCGGSSTSGNTNTNTNTVTFTTVYSDILSKSCTPCHAPGGVGDTAGKLDMSTQALAYTNLQMTAAGSTCESTGLELVVPGDAAKSLLLEKVESNPPCGVQMPYGCPTTTMPCLTTAQVQEIEDWINDGAMNN